MNHTALTPLSASVEPNAEKDTQPGVTGTSECPPLLPNPTVKTEPKDEEEYALGV